MKSSRHGFTLVELLVVVGIIALLISMLLPALNKARRAAMKTQCLSNLRQISTAVYLYLNDNKGIFPGGEIYKADGSVFKRTQMGWVGKRGLAALGYDHLAANDRPLNRYLGGHFAPDDPVEIAHCPEDNANTFGGTSLYDSAGTSYGANVVFEGTISGADDPWRGVNQNKVRQPSRMVMIADEGAFYPGWSGDLTQRQFYWHSRDPMWNVAFVDGHAATVRIDRIFSDSDYTFILGL
ncbi:MAG: type II secretion system protein [Phycisphaerales bacterium]|nr:type II secretion system protein [Phycisphaerales bacterium]